MVVVLGPGKFYGSSLPRPRIYTDVKHNDHRVDPPIPVLDPLMSWAEEAHWSMGGLNVKRVHLQGRIEGCISKLRAEHDRSVKAGEMISKTASFKEVSGRRSSASPPPAPMAVKRRRRMLVDDDEEEGVARKGAARMLWEEFDKEAEEGGMMKKEVRQEAEGVVTRTRSRGSGGDVAVKRGELKKKGGGNGVRVSPRLVKRGVM